VSRAIKILSFQNFYEVLKTCSAGRKDFFDTLKPGSRQASRFFVGTRLFSKQKTAFQGAGAVGNRKNFPGKTLKGICKETLQCPEKPYIM
jgi:hypothetical protein